MENKKPPKVYKVKDNDNDERFNDLHPNLMAIPCCLCIYGSVKQGKTNLLINMTCSKEMYKNRFDEVYFISNTLNGVDNKGKIMKKHFTCFDHYEDKIIEDILDKQKSYPEGEAPLIAIFLDDILSKDFKKTNVVSFLATRYRHYNIGMLCFTSQAVRSVSPMIRGNCSDVIIFKQQSSKEYEKLMDEYGEFFGEEKFREMYELIMSERFAFMYLKLSENPAQLFKNFEERLI
tara:strand:- start:591 stop:1289 length:699 start_codon:yes stop_codon:yes gene_type:complete